MKLTNRLGLPQPIVDAVANDSYTGGGSGNYISVTSLIAPPRQVALKIKHADEIVEDASDRIWSLLGQVVHGILERAEATGIAERRLSIDVEGWKVSGQMDRYIDGTLQDYKLTSAWSVKGGAKEEWETQLNCYAAILRAHGHEVKRIEAIAILRDWSKMEAARDPEYPQAQVVMFDIPVWDSERAMAFIRDRVILHKQARLTLPECSEEDRWARATTYAVMKAGKDRAVKLYDSEVLANQHASTDPKNLFVAIRPGQSIRCLHYCSVAQFCDQYKKTKEPNKASEVE